MAEHALRQIAAGEAQLIEHARLKDRAAIRLIASSTTAGSTRIARSIMRDDSEAEDVLQEAYVRAFSSLDVFRGEAQIGTWLARIVINEALACLRRRRPSLYTGRPGLNAQIIPFRCANPELDPETTMARREIRSLLERAIDELPDSCAASWSRDWSKA